MSKVKTEQKQTEGTQGGPGRDCLLHFRVSQKELEMIETKMKQAMITQQRVAKNVTIMPPDPALVQRDIRKKRLRVAPYCRVSTDSDEQLNSYEAQIEYYTAKIADNPEWTMVRMYADEGITGTSMKKRKEFLRLIADCKKGRVDLVITKSVTRFARNTLEGLQTVRQLKGLGIGVYFEKENVNTLYMDNEMICKNSPTFREEVLHTAIVAAMNEMFSQQAARDVLRESVATALASKQPKMSLGDHVFIAPNCLFTTAEHALDPEQRNAGLEVALPISIGNNVWIGAGTIVLGGVSIGDNTVIGAGSVVTKSIPANVVAVGAPCRVLREITEEDKKRYPVYMGTEK